MRRGFTLIELVITIVIIGILSIIAVPVYRGYTRRAMAAEARALVGAVAAAQRVFYAEYRSYLTLGSPAVAGLDRNLTGTALNTTLDVDARNNRYFTSFTVTGGANNYSVTTNGVGDATGISVTLNQRIGGQPQVIENGL